MVKVWKFVGWSVVFWFLLNMLVLHELGGSGGSKGVDSVVAGRRSAVMPPKGGVSRGSLKEDASFGSGHLEADDSGDSDLSVASSQLVAEDDGVKSVIATAPPTKHPKSHGGAKKDPIPRSIGNSVAAAHTRPVTITSSEDAVARFLVVGDWGGPGRDPQRNVARSMDHIASSSEDHHIHFVVSTGDNMYEDGVSGVKDRKFKRNFEDVYTQPALQCVWYMSLGNHDHGAHGVMRDAQAEVNYTQHSSRWFLPSTYYAQEFIVKGGTPSSSFRLLLVVLDTYDYSPRVTQMTETQVRWFESVLLRSTAEVKVVVGHRPLFSAGAKHGSSPYMQKKLEPLMVTHGVSAYLCGDDHELQVMQSKGVIHLLSGGGSRAKKDLKPKGIPQTIFQAGVHGFMWVAVKRNLFQVEVYNQHAEKLFDQSFPTAKHPAP
jgi:tartrate-resistant acid phosphatase type 5